MYDQADELRQLARRGTATAYGVAPNWITVAGGKGGVGTTTVAIGLAHALALAGRRVVLVDGDLAGPDLASYVGVEPRYTICDVLASRRSVHEALEAGPAGVQYLLGPPLDRRPLDCTATAQERLIEQIQNLGQHADVVIVDAGAGASRAMRRFWQAANDLVLVTTTDPVAIVDTYAALKQLYTREPNQAVHAIVNQGADPLESAAVGDRLGEACRRFLALSLASTTILPADASLSSAATGQPGRGFGGNQSPAGERFESWAESWIAARSNGGSPSHRFRGTNQRSNAYLAAPTSSHTSTTSVGMPPATQTQ